jgi:hypothetical protein
MRAGFDQAWIPRVWIGECIFRKHRIQRQCTRGEHFRERKAPTENSNTVLQIESLFLSDLIGKRNSEIIKIAERAR